MIKMLKFSLGVMLFLSGCATVVIGPKLYKIPNNSKASKTQVTKVQKALINDGFTLLPVDNRRIVTTDYKEIGLVGALKLKQKTSIVFDKKELNVTFLYQCGSPVLNDSSSTGASLAGGVRYEWNTCTVMKSMDSISKPIEEADQRILELV